MVIANSEQTVGNKFNMDQVMTLAPGQLEKMALELDLVYVALIALTGIDHRSIRQFAEKLGVEYFVRDVLNSDRWHQFQEKVAKPTIDLVNYPEPKALKALVWIAANIAQENQDLIRRGISLLESVVGKNQPAPAILLDNYLSRFSDVYHQTLGNLGNLGNLEVNAQQLSLSANEINDLGLRLLIDLFFYSSPAGDRHLMSALLDRTQ